MKKIGVFLNVGSCFILSMSTYAATHSFNFKTGPGFPDGFIPFGDPDVLILAMIVSFPSLFIAEFALPGFNEIRFLALAASALVSVGLMLFNYVQAPPYEIPPEGEGITPPDVRSYYYGLVVVVTELALAVAIHFRVRGKRFSRN